MTANGLSSRDRVQCAAAKLLSDVGIVATCGDPFTCHTGALLQSPDNAVRAIAKSLLNKR